MEEKSLIINDLHCTYYRSKNFSPQSPCVFLHGWGSDATVFNNIFPLCPNAIALDLPGFGKSQTPQKAWTVTNYAMHVRRVLEKLQITNPVFVGHSFGGSIVIHLAASKFMPEPEKLILIGSAGVRTKSVRKTALKVVTKMIKPLFSLPLLRRFRSNTQRKLYETLGVSDYLNAGPMKETIKNIFATDLTPLFQNVSAPVTLIWGEHDTDTPLAHAHIMKDHMPHATLHIVENAGHYVFQDQPEKFVKIFKTAL